MNFEAVIVQFDEARGDGVMRDGRGREFYFHCVAIADGSRVVDPGAIVTARRMIGLRGRDEATDVVKR